MTETDDSDPIRDALASVFRDVVAACNPTVLVEQILSAGPDVLVVGDHSFDLSEYDAIDVVGFGKAGAPMARAVEDALGDRIRRGLVVVRDGYDAPTRQIEVVEAAHPVPDERSVRAAERIHQICADAGERDLVLVLISGGGSALLVRPAEGISLEQMQTTVDELVTSGADIRAVNTVRKHISAIKGGQLARALVPATSVSLVLSDVIGNDLSSIASGPTAPDSTTFRDALDVLERYDLFDRVPEAVVDHLRRGASGEIEDTPGTGDPAFDRARHVLVGDARTVAEAAVHACEDRGWAAEILATEVTGEARDVGLVVSAIGKEMARAGENPPRARISTGETTVTVRGSGRGGRNQELALSAALEIEDIAHLHIASFATDGTDGPTDAAGAIVDGNTARDIRRAGQDPHERLADNDAYRALDASGSLVRTRPTMTNLNDLVIVLTSSD